MKITNSLKERLVYFLKKLIQIPTENPPGKTEEVVNFLVNEVFRVEEGYRNTIITHMKNGVKLHNLISRIGSGKKRILLSGHFDVVPVGDQNKWIYPPFSGKIVDDKIYGRGSADMKGGIASLIGVMKILESNRDFMEKYELVFIGTADEESGMTGSLTLSKKGYVNGAELIIIAEPTNLNIGIAEKGLLWIKIRGYGKSAHGSMPTEGINAIEAVLEIIPQLHECLSSEENELLGQSTINVGKIYGGTKINIVPDYTELEVDFRLIPEENHESVIKKLNGIKSNSCKIEVEILRRNPSLQTNLNHQFIQNLREISNRKCIGLSYATDAVNFVRKNDPIPFIIFGPGDPNIVHKINEWISLEQVFKATELLTKALLITYIQ